MAAEGLGMGLGPGLRSTMPLTKKINSIKNKNKLSIEFQRFDAPAMARGCLSSTEGIASATSCQQSFAVAHRNRSSLSQPRSGHDETAASVCADMMLRRDPKAPAPARRITALRRQNVHVTTEKCVMGQNVSKRNTNVRGRWCTVRKRERNVKEWNVMLRRWEGVLKRRLQRLGYRPQGDGNKVHVTAEMRLTGRKVMERNEKIPS